MPKGVQRTNLTVAGSVAKPSALRVARFSRHNVYMRFLAEIFSQDILRFDMDCKRSVRLAVEQTSQFDTQQP